jgi:signal transduction histidine kinase
VRWPDVAGAAFVAVYLAAMVRWQLWHTLPFQVVWVTLTMAYGFRAARRRDVALAQARRATERERDFVRDASRLLRAPVTVARGHAELAARTAAGPERRELRVVVHELARLSRISDRLLMLAAADHPGFTSVRPVDPGALIDTTVERWAAAAPRHFVAANRLAGTLEGDERRLVCALDALIENAVRATRDGDVIVLRGAVASDGTAELEVVDLGAGIAPDILPRIFDRVARWPPRGGGLGLGLPVAKAIVEAHGGNITVSSTLGMGTCVRLRLPGYEETPSGSALGAGDARPPAAAPRAGRRLALGQSSKPR